MSLFIIFFFFSSRRRHTRSLCDWSSDVCSSDLIDAVIEESIPTYDADGNILYTTRYQRTSSVSVPNGDLATGWAVGNSRRTFVASWFDLANRTTTVADYGNNADAAFTRPASAPAPNGSANILVT